MSDDSVPLLLVLIFLVILSGFFSSAETAYSCASRIKLRALATNGNKRAEKTLLFAENKFDQLISTVLIGNNIVNITTATLAALFFSNILKNSPADPTLIATVVMTLVVLVFGEITPKFIAKAFPEKLAMAYQPVLYFFYILLYPLNLVFSGWKFLLSKIFRLKHDDKITEDEILTVVEEAEEDGTIKKEETRLIRSVIEFDDLEVSDILVPRVNITAADLTSSMDDIKMLFEKEGYSRIPIYKDSVDAIIGTVHEKDFYGALLSGKKTIEDIIQPAFFTTEHVKISNLLKQLQKNKVHLAIVLDEYGGTAGIVTLEDVLEELVGEIWDEHDEEINFFTQDKNGETTVDGNAPLEDFFEYFGLKNEEEKFDALTLSGWIIEKLGEIPQTGFVFEYENLTIEITKATVKRVLKTRVTIKENS